MLFGKRLRLFTLGDAKKLFTQPLKSKMNLKRLNKYHHDLNISKTMQSQNLYFEPLTEAHADNLFAVLTTPAVLAFINPKPPTFQEFKSEYAIRARGPVNSILPTEQWFNMAILLKDRSATAIGRLEATSYNGWGEVAYMLGEIWWGKGLAFEAMQWWHKYLDLAIPKTEWWATVHPENQRSIRLLTRLGYKEVLGKQSILQSEDVGDRCFVRSLDVSKERHN